MDTAVTPAAPSTTTTTAYDDIYVRDNYQDKGQTPTQGTLWASPDIIPYGAGTLTMQQLESTYNGPDLGRNITNQEVNNIYVRARNLSSNCPDTGRVRLYIAPGSLLLHPNQWRPITPAANGSPYVPLANGGTTQIGPGQICASSPAFYWTGDPNAAQYANHYCMVAMVDTPRHPAPPLPTDFSSNHQFANWVANLPSVAWRNISIVAPSCQSLPGVPLVFCNVDRQPREFVFVVRCTNITSAGTVRIQCTDQRCHIDDGGSVTPTNFKRSFGPYSVPGKFTGTIIFSYTGTQPLGPNVLIEVDYYVLTEDAAEAGELSVPAADVLEGTRAAGSMVRLGQYSFNSAVKSWEGGT